MVARSVFRAMPVLLTCIIAVPVHAATCFYFDFDDDDDPWTLTTENPDRSGTIRFILEVPENLPVGQPHYYWFFPLWENCAYFEPQSFHFDPAIIELWDLIIPVGAKGPRDLEWGVEFYFSETATLTPGERYFFGSVECSASCEGSCEGSETLHEVSLPFRFDVGSCLAQPNVILSLSCPLSMSEDFVDPASMVVGAPCPNPAASSVSCSVRLPTNTHLHAAVYDVCGRFIAELADEPSGPGIRVLEWQPPSPARGSPSPGVYFLVVTAGAEKETRMFVVGH